MGEDRILSKETLEDAIREGVVQGIFGLGEIKSGKIIPVYWKKEPTLGFEECEVLIDKSICERELEKPLEEVSKQKTVKKETFYEEEKKETISKLELPLIKIPKGKVSQLLGLLNFLQSKFDNLEIKIAANEGEMDKRDYENKVKEALKQLGVEE
ncbi:hypothetical protein D6817_00490 [Candidatus Pacearchaeota archaeon]|nr:MAG: hypothetical protein D6817_00490 [Candidatus Pacearchaeota archaeon]